MRSGGSSALVYRHARRLVWLAALVAVSLAGCQTAEVAAPLEVADAAGAQSRQPEAAVSRGQVTPLVSQLTPSGETDDVTKAEVYRGRYFVPDGFAAQDDLRQTRMIALGDDYPFQNVELVSLSESERQISADPLNLKQYRGMEMYSLQIAVYDDAFGAKFREAAEQAARVLRSDAVEAYYYHGPNRSMITVGLIPYQQAFDSQIGRADIYSQYVREMQRKFPYNLLNGRTIIESPNTDNERQQPSFLVPVR